MIDMGDYVKEQYGDSGFITHCFRNFQKISEIHITNKSGLNRSKLILLSKADIDEIKNIL